MIRDAGEAESGASEEDTSEEEESEGRGHGAEKRKKYETLPI